MPAKPILDIMIVAADPAALIPMLEAIGYEYRPASFAEDTGTSFCGSSAENGVPIMFICWRSTRSE